MLLGDTSSPLNYLINTGAVRRLAGTGEDPLRQPWFGQLMTGAQWMLGCGNTAYPSYKNRGIKTLYF